MIGSLALEVPESDATGRVAAGYRFIRQTLTIDNVPTVFRILATNIEAFELALDGLPAIVDLAHEHNFVACTVSVARDSLANQGPSVLGVHDWHSTHTNFALREVLQHYRRVNPINLLFSFAVTGLSLPFRQDVMAPPLPQVSAVSPQDDIADCHAGGIVPGVWLDLAHWPSSRSKLWSAIREFANTGGLQKTSLAVHKSAFEFSQGTIIEELSLRLEHSLNASVENEMNWFPTGISTMIAEVERLINLPIGHY